MENGVQSDSDSAGTNKNWFVYLRYELTVYIIFSQWMVLYVSRFINHIFYQHDYTHTHSYTHYYIILYIYFTNNFDLLRFIRHILLWEATVHKLLYLYRPTGSSVERSPVRRKLLFSQSQKILAFLAPHSPRCISQIWDICNWQYLIFSTYILLHHVNETDFASVLDSQLF